MRSGDTAHRARSIPVPAALCVSSQRCPNACVANKETSGPHSASNQRARQPASGLHPITLTLTLTLTRTLTLPGPDPIPALPLTLTLTLPTEEVFILETQPPRRRDWLSLATGRLHRLHRLRRQLHRLRHLLHRLLRQRRRACSAGVLVPSSPVSALPCSSEWSPLDVGGTRPMMDC